MKNPPMSGAEMRAIRRKAKLTKPALCEILGMGQSSDRTLRRYEAGERTIPGPLRFAMRAIAAGFHKKGKADE